MILLKFFGFIAKRIFHLLITFGLIGGAVFATTLYYIDSFTSPQLGTYNIYLIAGALSFFPLFFALFFEIYSFLRRRKKKQIKKRDASYLDETFDKKPINA